MIDDTELDNDPFFRYKSLLLEPGPIPVYALKLLGSLTEHSKPISRYVCSMAPPALTYSSSMESIEPLKTLLHLVPILYLDK